MATRLKYPHDYELYEKVLDLVEKYAFRVFRLQEKRSNTGQASLIRKGYELFHGEIDSNTMLNKIRAQLLKYSTDDEYRAAFELGKNWYQFSGLKYFLYEYEEYLAKGKEVQLPWESVQKRDKKNTIEHILPQFPILDYWTQRWTQEQIQRYLHDIGNLTLTFGNSTYGYKAFPEKKGKPGTSGYWNSNMFQESELAKWEDWTEKELLERRNQIIEWALERWKVEPAGEENVADEEDEEDIEEELKTEDASEDEIEDEVSEAQEWEPSLILQYLHDLEEGRFVKTLYYFKALAFTDKPLAFGELLTKLGELTGKRLSGRVMAGVWSGIYKISKKLKKERLELLNYEEDRYSLKPKYKEIIRQYFSR